MYYVDAVGPDGNILGSDNPFGDEKTALAFASILATEPGVAAANVWNNPYHSGDPISSYAHADYEAAKQDKVWDAKKAQLEQQFEARGHSIPGNEISQYDLAGMLMQPGQDGFRHISLWIRPGGTLFIVENHEDVEDAWDVEHNRHWLTTNQPLPKESEPYRTALTQYMAHTGAVRVYVMSGTTPTGTILNSAGVTAIAPLVTKYQRRAIADIYRMTGVDDVNFQWDLRGASGDEYRDGYGLGPLLRALDEMNGGVEARGDVEGPSISAILASQPWTRTREEFQAGKVPGFSYYPDATWAGYSFGGRRYGVGPSYFNFDEFGMKLLILHEIGHDIAGPFSLDPQAMATLEPFKLAGTSGARVQYDNFAGFSRLPEEFIADVYALLMIGDERNWESDKYLAVFDAVRRVANSRGYPTSLDNNARPMAFTEPFPASEPAGPMADGGLAGAMRLDLAGELDAITLYDAHLRHVADPEIASALTEIRDDEKDHAAKFEAILARLDPAKPQVLPLAERDDMPEELRAIAARVDELDAMARALDDAPAPWETPRPTPPTPGIVTDEGAAGSATCKRVTLPSGEVLTFCEGVIGPLSASQQRTYCASYETVSLSGEQAERLGRVRAAAEAAKAALAGREGDAGYLSSYFAAMDNEYRKGVSKP